MRPAYRFSLAAAVVLAALAAAGAWWSRHPAPVAPVGSGPAQVTLDPLPPSAGDPGPEKTKEILDKLEAAEADKVGPAEARRRRAERERMLDLRLHGEPQ